MILLFLNNLELSFLMKFLFATEKNDLNQKYTPKAMFIYFENHCRKTFWQTCPFFDRSLNIKNIFKIKQDEKTDKHFTDKLESNKIQNCFNWQISNSIHFSIAFIINCQSLNCKQFHEPQWVSDGLFLKSFLPFCFACQICEMHEKKS